ncbi:MAG: rRNA maturation RNase YbeY [Candidatus Kapabacteria bacterium]|nr:rRNA maturation RNase YbeY [Candidatus Kapabacteria bacterium]
MPVNVNVFNTTSQRYRGKAAMIASVQKTFRGQRVRQASVNIILLDDASIKTMNKKYLGHNYATDVITFPLEATPVVGEIYISIDTARQQSKDYGVTLTNELCRLAVHGALHLCGHDDGTEAERLAMQKLENRYITDSL